MYLLIFTHSSPAQTQAANAREWQSLHRMNAPACTCKPQQPDDAENCRLLFLHAFLKATLSESPDNTKAWEVTAENTEDLYDHLPDNAPQKNHYTAELLLAGGFMNLREGSELEAAWQLRKAYRLLAGHEEDFPDYQDHYALLGIMQTLLGSIPEKYQWALPVLGMAADGTEGHEQLELAAYELEYPENITGLLFLSMAETYLLNKPDRSLERMDSLIGRNPDMHLARYLQVTMQLKNFRGQDALQNIRTLQSHADSSGLNFGLLQYYNGEALIRKGNYKEAITAYERFLHETKGRHFIKDAYFKTGLAWWLLGNEENMKAAFASAVREGAEQTDTDKYAYKVASGEAALSTPALYKARLHMDGGYFKDAESMLKRSGKPDGGMHLAEWYYRMARIAHLTDRLTLAGDYYRKTIQVQDGPYYFAPNACLQLGYMLAEQGEPEKARAYFEKAIAYKHHPYESGIEQKAKAALKELP